jgi:hypothetical protein
MKIRDIDDSSDLRSLNEMFVRVEDNLPSSIENSIYYPKLKQLLFNEIVDFCREQLELKEDLQLLRLNIGEQFSESEIREYLDMLKAKYNDGKHDNVGLDYHIESTRIDYGVPVFVIIKREEILMKKFVFRFRKYNINASIGNLSNGDVPEKDQPYANKAPKPEHRQHHRSLTEQYEEAHNGI